MIKYIPDIFKEINNNPELLMSVYKDNYVVRTLLQYAFDKNLKMDLPEGTPPFKKDPAPIGMSPSTLYNQVKKLYIFTRKDLSDLRKEQLFVQLLESIHPTEAEIVIHVKDQTLTSKYPNITPELVIKAEIVAEENIFRTGSENEQKEMFSGPTENSKEINDQSFDIQTQPEGKNLVLNISDTTYTAETFGKPSEQKTFEENHRDIKKKGRPKKIN